MPKVTEEFRVPTKIAQTLTQLTNEPRPEVSLQLVIKDALEHRLEQVEHHLQQFNQKYAMPFQQFTQKWREDQIPNRHSYNIEKDYWEWEGLVSRQEKLKQLQQ